MRKGGRKRKKKVCIDYFPFEAMQVGLNSATASRVLIFGSSTQGVSLTDMPVTKTGYRKLSVSQMGTLTSRDNCVP